MLVLQVTDKDRSRRVELGDQPLLVGSDPGCDLVFTDQGLAPEHIALKPAGRDVWRLRVLRGKGILLNGTPLREGNLTRGDRITIGSVTLEVLESAHRHRTPARPGRRPPRRRADRRRSAPWELVGILGVIVVALALYTLLKGSGSDLGLELTRLTFYLENWELDRAGKRLASLADRVEGGGSAAADLEKLQREYDNRRQAESRAEAFMDPLWEKAGRIGHLRMGDLIRERIGRARREGDELLADYLEKQCLIGLRDRYLARAGDRSGERAREFLEGQEARIPVAEAMVRVDELLAEGRIMAALQLVEAGAAEAGSKAAAADYMLRRRTIIENLEERIEDATYRAINLANAGRARRALSLLANVRNRMPPIRDLARPLADLEKLNGEILELARFQDGDLGEPTVTPGKPEGKIDWGRIAGGRKKEKELATSRRSASETLEAARKLEKAWRFAEAGRLYRAIAPEYEAATARARLAGHKVAFLRELGRAVKADPEPYRNIRLADGALARVVAAGPEGFTILDSGQEVAYPWTVMGLEGVLAMGRRAGLSGPAQLGLAALALDGGKKEEFDRILLAATRREPELLARAESMLARRTGRQGPFCWFREKWMPVAEKKELVRLEELARELDGIMVEKDLEKRTAALRELAGRGALERGAVARGLEDRLYREVGRLRQDPFFRLYDKIAEVRRQLDSRREEALDLIFDEEKYFHPFKPPECPPEKAKEYPAVQREVDRRVRAVERVWQKGIAARITTSFRRRLDESLWLHRRLAALVERPDPATVELMEVVFRLPLDQDKVDLRSFAWTPAEQRRLYYDRRVMRYNLVAEVEPTVVEMDQVQITNEYRLMMGRRALAVNAKLLRSARKHSEEMSSLGYFSHFSPVAENRTPFLRMRNEGYTRGVSENIARGLGPEGAHVAWLHSSGHHRNILQPTHTEFASGNSGNFWTQNFGTGVEFKSDPLFEKDTLYGTR